MVFAISWLKNPIKDICTVDKSCKNMYFYVKHSISNDFVIRIIRFLYLIHFAG